jgi:hypothetical protein
LSTDLDAHGQPLAFGFNNHRRLERDISELLGLAKGLLADGSISDAEAVLLHEWMTAHPEPVTCWPCDRIAARRERIFEDGIVAPDEREDLAHLLSQLVGGDAGILEGENAATALPLDRPPPALVFGERIYVFTGKFAFGTRAACARATAEHGGQAAPNITEHTNYLVIGTFGSRDWVHASHGRKIEKAVEYRDRGVPLSIVAERHWVAAVGSDT